MRSPGGTAMRRIVVVLGCLAALAVLLPVAAEAAGPLGVPVSVSQDEEPASRAPAADSPEAVRAMVARLTDAEVRALLLQRLDVAATADAKGSGAASDLAEFGEAAIGAGTAFLGSIGRALEVMPNLARGWSQGFGAFYEMRGAVGTVWLLATLALALAAGAVACAALQRATASLRAPVVVDADETLGRQARRHLLRLACEIADVVVLVGVALAVAATVTRPEPPMPQPSDWLVLWFVLTRLVLGVLLVAAVTRVLFAPGRPDLRLIAMDDAPAAFLHRGLVIFALITAGRGFLLNFLGGHGVDLGQIRVGFWITIVQYGWLLWVAFRARAALTQSLIGHAGRYGAITPFERRVAVAYPWIAMALIAGFWVLTETLTGLQRFDLLDGRLPITLLILIFAPAADRAIRALVWSVRAPAEGEGEQAAAAFVATRQSYTRIGRVALAALVLWLISQFWEIGIARMASAGIGARLGERLVEALGIVAVGYVLIELVRIRINSMLAREKAPVADAPTDPGADAGEGGGVGLSRLGTVLPLVSWALQSAIAAITFLTALGTIGINTTPLLAGAGVIGLAVGFGAQTLVSDIVSGIFFLIDDAFRTGEYVEVAGTYGTVEKITLRSLVLRHHEGPVHTIPFGTIPRLTNYSRDWVIMKLRFTVPFNTDLNKVKKIFKKIGAEMMEIPEFEKDFLQPFKSQGVLMVDDVGIVIRGKFMAKPGRQWVLRKEIYQRVQQAFEANGIQFARKEVRVRIDGEPGALGEAEKHIVAAAAAEASEEGSRPTGPLPADPRPPAGKAAAGH